MKVRLTLMAVIAGIALVGAGCGALTQQVSTPEPPEGPSPFLAGFSVPRIMASFEAMPDGPRCPEIQPSSMTVNTTGRDSSFDGWSHAELATSCDDPGGGTGLAQAWAAGIDAELRRFGADELGGGISTDASGASSKNTWEYASNGLRGHITVQILPGPDGQFWSVVRIFEPS
jgi:hypothetical protein